MEKDFLVIQALQTLPIVVLKRGSILISGFEGKSVGSPEILRFRFDSNIHFP